MLIHLIQNGVLEIQPGKNLNNEDIQALTQTVDSYLETHDKLHGILVHTEHFPVWEDFKTMISHIQFVKNHHQKIDKVALVTNSTATIIAPIVDHFTKAEVKKFNYADIDLAKKWISEA